MRTLRVTALGALLLLAGACGKDDTFADAAPAPDAEPDGATCPERWTVTADPGADATVSDGALVIVASNVTDDSAIEVVQAGLTGDFDVRFEVTDFEAGGTGAFVQAAISPDVAVPLEKVTAAFGTFPTVGISAAADVPGGDVQIMPTTLTAGSLRFARTGTSVTITATTTDATATVTATMADSPLRVGVQVGSNNGAVAPTTRAELGAFTVTSGTGVDADTFDCDSLAP